MSREGGEPDELAEVRALARRAADAYAEAPAGSGGRAWMGDKLGGLQARVRALEGSARKDRRVSDEVATLARKLADAERELARWRAFGREAERRMGKSWMVRRWDEVEGRLAEDKEADCGRG